MATPAEAVASSFALAQTYANDAKTALGGFTDALSAAIPTAGSVNLTWTTIKPPDAMDPLVAPTAEVVAPDIVALGAAPAPLDANVPTVDAIAFGEVAPVPVFGVAPTPAYGAAPSVPTPGAVAMPTMGALSFPGVPTYLSLSSPTFGGVDLHAAFLTNFDNIPTLTLVAPTPYSYALGAEYASTLLTTLKSVLTTRMAGGTGLNTAVEQAIWDRARSRETQIALGNESEIMRASEAMGFQLPTGVLAAQLREAQQGYYDKLSGLSRDVAIKQADLEQANLQQTITAGMALEGQLIDYSYKLEQLTFEAAKTQADNAIQVHNSQIEKYKALLGAYQVYAEAYRAIISAELAKVEVYKAQIAGEQAKADVNKTLVEQYKATIEAQMSYVEIYKAEIGGAQALVQLEQLKIAAAGEQIKAYVAKINGFTAEVEGYKAGVDAEVSKTQIYKIKADAFAAEAGLQVEVARANIARYQALAHSKSLELDGYKSKVEVEKFRMEGVVQNNERLFKKFTLDTDQKRAAFESSARLWEVQIKDYEAGISAANTVAKINADVQVSTNAQILDAAKAGAQVYAQLTSSAYSMIHASAGVTAGATNSVSYQYSNDTSSSPSSVTAI